MPTASQKQPMGHIPAIRGGDYHLTHWHGEGGTVFTLVPRFGSTLAGWEPVLSFRHAASLLGMTAEG